jgi:hypothetical protein
LLMTYTPTSQVHRMTSNNAFELTVMQRGRTVRAVALCARAGAQWRAWPAAQRDR